MSELIEGELIQFSQSESNPEMVEVTVLVSKSQFEYLEVNLLYQEVEIKLAEPKPIVKQDFLNMPTVFKNLKV
jgi:hypothetical protein